ncbi:MAG: PD40 domain-containing protein [Spirochaetales bacterium]|nr:PD40 domain-containing protein [Spirochaetales bacterium]
MRAMKWINPGISAIVFALCLAAGLAGCAARATDVLTNPEVFGRSADDLHYAWAQVDKNGKVIAVVDGRPGALESDEISAIVFSPDGSHYAYSARNGSKWRMVADGAPLGPEVDEINPACVVYSPDGNRLAYGARLDQKWHVVMDGRVDLKAGYDSLASFAFSPDGRRFACVAGSDAKQAVVADDRPGRFYDTTSEPVWSPDGKRLGYAATEDNLHFVVLDGSEGKPYDWVGPPVFSFDGRHFAYGAAKGEKRLVVTDGTKEGPEYEMPLNIDPIAFGPKDHRLAYAVKKDGQWVMVVDGREGPGYVDIALGSIALNPSGKGFAYIAAVPGAWVVVENSRHSPSYDETAGGGQLTYSADGRHLIYGARKNKKWFIVLDGKAGAELDYKEITAPTFSPDGKHIMYNGRKGKKWFVVVDGAAGPSYDSVHRPLLTNKGVEYLAEREEEDSLLRCRLPFTSAEAGRTVETKLSPLPKEDPAEICKPCRQQQDLLNEEE